MNLGGQNKPSKAPTPHLVAHIKSIEAGIPIKETNRRLSFQPFQINCPFSWNHIKIWPNKKNNEHINKFLTIYSFWFTGFITFITEIYIAHP